MVDVNAPDPYEDDELLAEHRKTQRLLSYAHEHYPERVEAVDMRQLLADSARGNERRPAWIKLQVPDRVALSLRGPEAKSESRFLLVEIPREIEQRSESRIILPGE